MPIHGSLPPRPPASNQPGPGRDHDDPAVVLDRRQGRSGELVLRRSGEHLEVIEDGVFLMDTRDGRSERLLVRACLGALEGDGLRVAVGGLGVGFSLLEALADPRVARVVVVELEPVLIGWHRHELAAVTAGALDDPRVDVVEADVVTWLRDGASTFDAICLDVDNGPDWLVREANGALYDAAGLAAACGRLVPGGVLGVWSAAAAPRFEALLRQAFESVQVHRVEVARGEPDVVWVAARPHRPADAGRR